MSCTLLLILVIPRKMTAAPHVMLAASYLMFAKDQRGRGLEEPPRAPGDLPPLPLYFKKLQCQKMIFGTLGTKKIESDN